jgi:hypothetical protein
MPAYPNLSERQLAGIVAYIREINGDWSEEDAAEGAPADTTAAPADTTAAPADTVAVDAPDAEPVPAE